MFGAVLTVTLKGIRQTTDNRMELAAHGATFLGVPTIFTSSRCAEIYWSVATFIGPCETTVRFPETLFTYVILRQHAIF